MTLMHLTSSRFFGGPERQMLGLSQELNGRVETIFVSFSEDGLNQSFLRKVSDAGFCGIGLQSDTPFLIAAYREIASLIRRHSIDVLICHGYKASLIGWFVARRSKIPAIAVSRGWTYENWRVRLYEKLDRWMLRRMNKVICVSQAQADMVAASGVRPECIEVIHNSISPARFQDRDPAYRTKLLDFFLSSARPQIKYVVGAAGRLSPEKGFDLLIEAAKQVLENRDDIGFIVFGDGEMLDSLHERIQALGIKELFVLAGFTDELDRFIPHLDLFVQSSHTEGLPNVLLEAGAAGIPVVATCVGGTAEVIIDEQTGLAVPPNNSRAIADGICRLVSNECLRATIAEQLRAHVAMSFTFATQAAAYCDVFASLTPKTQHAV